MIRTFIQERKGNFDELLQINTESGEVKIYAVDKELGFPFSEYYSTVSEMGYTSISEMVKTMERKETKKEIDTDEQTKKEINGLYNLAEYRARNGGNIFMRLKNGSLYNDISERLKKYGISESESMNRIQNIAVVRSI